MRGNKYVLSVVASNASGEVQVPGYVKLGSFPEIFLRIFVLKNRLTTCVPQLHVGHYYFFHMALQPNAGYGPLIHEVS
jgi:hypothetical protein